MKLWIKRWMQLGLALGVVLALGLTAAQAQSGPRLRLAHMSPGAPPGDIYLDGNLLQRNVAFRTVTDYIAISAGDHVVRVVPTGTGGPIVAEATLPFVDGKDYSIFVVGRTDNIQVWPLEDNNTTETERARVRVVHVSPDAPALDICYSGGNDCPVTNLTYKNASGYLGINPGTYTLDARRSGTNEVIYTASNLRFDRGVVYSLLATGLTQGDPGFQLTPRADSVRAPSQPPVTGALLSPVAIRVLSTILIAFLGGLWLAWRIGQK